MFKVSKLYIKHLWRTVFRRIYQPAKVDLIFADSEQNYCLPLFGVSFEWFKVLPRGGVLLKFCFLVLFNFILIDKCRQTQLIYSKNYSMKQVVFDNQFFVICYTSLIPGASICSKSTVKMLEAPIDVRG